MIVKRQDLPAVLAELGIPDDYGVDPRLPGYDKAQDLVEVEANFTGRVQLLARDTARKWSGM